jgi:hypothetical protein
LQRPGGGAEPLRAQLVGLDHIPWLDVLTWSRPDSSLDERRASEGDREALSALVRDLQI